MAVEIPVIVDIDKAFADAAKRVPQAIEPLRKQISTSALNMEAVVGVDKKGNTVIKTFGDLLKGATFNASELRDALKEVNRMIREIQSTGGFNPTKELKTAEKDLLALRAALEIGLESGNFIDETTSKIKGLSTAAKTAGATSRAAIDGVNAGLRTQGGLLGMLTRYVSLYTAVFAGLRLIRNIRETTAEFEMQRVALGGIIQDATRANQLFAEIKAAAVQSPFQIKDLVSFTKQLSAYRIETDKLFDVTMRLADVSAGLGVDMSRLVLAYGQVRAASVLRGQELRQFTEAGIPLVELLAQKFSKLKRELVSTGEVFELISDRAVPFAMIEEIFNDMTDAGGIFYQMQIKQSETLKGQWMKLKDVLSIAYDEMGRTAMVGSAMRGLIQTTQELVRNWEKIAQVINIAVYSFLSYRLAVRGLIPVYNLQQKTIARQIQLEKRQQIEQIRLAAIGRKLTAAEEERIAQAKKMTAEDYKRIFSMDKMTQKQAILTFWRNKDNKEISKAIAQTGLLTKAQMASISKMSRMNVLLKAWGSSIRTLGTKIGSAIASFWPIAVMSAAITTIMDLVAAHQEQVQAIEKVDKAYREQEQALLKIQNGYMKIQAGIASVTKETERAKAEAASFGQKLEYAQKIVEMLKKYGLGGDYDLSLLDTDNIDKFVESWLEQLHKANDLTRDWGRSVAETLTAAEGPLHILGDNLKTDIAQLNSAYVKMTGNKKFRENVEEMRNYIEALELTHKTEYDLLTQALGMDAKLAVSQKRRNESEYQYQSRLIQNYEQIRKFAQSDKFMLNGAMKFFEPMNMALDKFNRRLDEVEREFDKTFGEFKGQDELTIKMAIDKLFAENEWEDWLKEAWIERLNGKYNMNIQVNPVVGKVDVSQGVKSIIATEFSGLFTEEELKNMNSVTEIGKAIQEKMNSAAQAIEDADRQANNLLKNDLWASKTEQKIQEAQIALSKELAKDEKDRNQEAINARMEEIDALTKQNQVYDEQIKKKKESAQAEYELAKAAKDRLLNEGLSAMGRDIRQAFPELISGNQIFDKINFESIGNKMKEMFPQANADLLARPLVDAAELVKKGWEEAGEGIATVYTSTFDYEDENGKHNLLITPILPDGSVLSPEELESYVSHLLASGSDILDADTKRLVIGIDVPEEAGEKLHELQEQYYDLQERMKNTAGRFLINEEELKNIKDGADAYDIWAKNIKAIADEREKLAGAGVDEATVAKEQAELDAQRIELTKQLEEIEERMAAHSYEEQKAKYDSLRLAVEQATTAAARAAAEAELQKFLKDTNFAETATLEVEKERLVAQLGITNAALGAKNAILDTFSVLDQAGKFWEEFGKRYNFTLKNGPKGGRGSTQDPWIMLFKNRMKFMQDFEKGVDNLNKYLSRSTALLKEQNIMEGRGLSLGINTKELLGTPEELGNWYKEAIDQVADKIKSMGGKEFAGLGVTEILAKDLTGRKIQKYQELLQSLWKEWTDFDTNQEQKKWEDALKKLSDDIKRSETARNFYNNILDLTGNEELAAVMGVSVYGDVGKEFRDRIQAQLDEAAQAVDASSMTEELDKALKEQDFDTILKNLEKFPKEWQKVLKDMAESDEKYTADLMKNFAELLSKYGDSTQKIATIKAKTENEIRKVEEAFTKAKDSGELSPEKLQALRKQTDELVQILKAQADLESFKQSDDYIKFFSELNVMTTEQAVLVRGKLREAYYKAFHEGAINADELRRNLRAVDEQFKKLNEDSSMFMAYLNGGIEGAIRKLQDYSDTVGILAQKMKSGKNLDDGERAFANQMFERFGNMSEATEGVKTIGDLVSKYGGDMSKAGDAMGQMGEAMGSMAANGPSALAIVDAIIKAVNSTIVGIQQIIDQLNEVRSEDKKIGGWFSYLSDFNKYAFSGWEKLKSGDLIGAATDVVSSLVSVGINIKKTFNKKYDKRIEAQAKLIEDLQYEYSRLGVAIEDAFGSDYVYNYNQQMEILQAQAEAYRKQAELERKKGKSGDESKAQEYEKAERDIRDQITDMQGQLAEFFTGTDLTSAARDFAQAWIEAYKEFGSTTDAMREKFDEMIENMVVNSLAARLVQGILKPIFDEIDKAAGEGDLSAQKIGEISALVPTAIEKIDNSLGTMVSQLSAAGINLRQQAGQFTGISRDFAGASEESILGLSAGVNTANFYMSHLPAIAENVAALRAYIVGDSAETVRTTASEGPTYEDQMLGYASNLPMMRDDMYAIRSLLEKVIKPVGTAYYVSVR